MNILHSPDVSSWAETTKITSLSLQPTGVHVEFDKKDSWPNVTPPGWDGPIQYTLWPVVTIGGETYTAACIEFWKGLDRNGGPVCDPGQLPKNWYYFAGEPLASYQPAPGEEVGFFVTSGDQRQKDVHASTEKSNIVKVPFQYGDWSFEEPKTDPIPPSPAPIPVVGGDLVALETKIDALSAKIDAYQVENRSAFAQVAEFVKKAFPWIR